MKKKQKIKTWDFRPSTSGSLPKTQKLARSLPRSLKQLVFLNGPETSGGPAKSNGRKKFFGGALEDFGTEASVMEFLY